MLTLKSFKLVVNSVLACNDADIIGNSKNGYIFVTIGNLVTEDDMRRLVESLKFNGYDAYLVIHADFHEYKIGYGLK